MPNVIFTPQADRQIAIVLNHTLAVFGVLQRDKYDRLINAAIKDLEINPLYGKHRPDIHTDAWTYHIRRRGGHARHLFLYRIRDKVEIARFLHDAMDIPRHWPEEWGIPESQKN